MITDRKVAFDTISRVLAITRLDIEQHQAINDLSLNIHGENYFRDVFNFVYDCDFLNANDVNLNEAYIDLVDTRKKKLVQITTTRKNTKISHSLKALLNKKYKGYEISIFYLLDKAMPNSKTIKEIESKYPVKLKDILKDHRNLINDINSLEGSKLIELANKYFVSQETKYTDQIVLDLVFKKLLKEKYSISICYDDDLGSIEASRKIVVNNINQRIASYITSSLDYTCIVDSIDDGRLSTDLRSLVIDQLYKLILIEKLKTKEKREVLLTKNTHELQLIAVEKNMDFNKLFILLSKNIESLVTVKDFNSMNISWILISYFFEICDVGVKE